MGNNSIRYTSLYLTNRPTKINLARQTIIREENVQDKYRDQMVKTTPSVNCPRSLEVFITIILIVLLQGCITTAQLTEQFPTKPINKAFAIGSDGKSGAAWGQSSVNKAINLALHYCRSTGSIGCRVVRINSVMVQNRPLDYFKTKGVKNYGHSQLFRCDELTKSQAYTFLLQGHFYLDRDGDGHPCEWEKTTYHHTAPVYYKSNCHWVKGYHRSNGTYVKGHQRCR